MFVIPAPNAVAFSLFGFPIYCYGILMAFAILVSTIVGNYLFNTFNKDLKKDVILSIAPLIIISGVIGARLYFCLLNYQYYFYHPFEILDIREGGLSIHGALFFGILSLIVLLRLKKISPLKVLDSLSCAVFLGQAIGRWGNYFNSEAYGLPVANQSWGLFIPPDHRIPEFASYNYFHPTFLYESILDVIGFVVLFFVLKRFGKKYSGITFFIYLIIYALIRFFIEQIRLDSALNLGSVPVAQVASIIMFVVGIFGVVFSLKHNLH